MSLQSRLTVEFPFSSGNLKLGFDTADRASANSNYVFSLLRGRSGLLKIAKEYENSYRTADNPTLLHYRDFMLSEALFECLVNVQYKDSNKTTLTTSSNRVWSTFSYDEIWRYLKPDPALHVENFKVADLIGSPAFYTKSLQLPSFYPRAILESLLSYIWSEVGLDVAQPSQVRLRSLVSFLKLNSSVLAKLSAAVPSSQAAVYKALKKNGFTTGEIGDLTIRILLGEYSDQELSLRSALLLEKERQILSQILFSCTFLLKPGGILLLLQTLVVESFLKVAQRIQLLDESLLQSSLEEFRYNPAYKNFFYGIASDLLIAYDVYVLFDKYKVFLNLDSKIKSLSNLIFFWLSASGIESVSSSVQSRLSISSIYESPSVKISDFYGGLDPFFSVLEEQPPRGKPEEALLLGVINKTSLNTTVRVTDIFGNPVDAQLSSIYNNGLDVFITSNTKTGFYTLASEGVGLSSIIATPLTGNIPSLESYLSQDNKLVASNPITISSQDAFVQVSGGSDQQTLETISLYQTAFGLQNNYTPGGSESDRYRINGLPFPGSVDHRVIIDSIKDTVYGTRKENTSKAVALYENIFEHIDSGIETAISWMEKTVT